MPAPSTARGSLSYYLSGNTVEMRNHSLKKLSDLFSWLEKPTPDSYLESARALSPTPGHQLNTLADDHFPHDRYFNLLIL